MSHTPFIVGSYVISAVVLLWAAFAPVIQKRLLLKQLTSRQARMDKSQ